MGIEVFVIKIIWNSHRVSSFRRISFGIRGEHTDISKKKVYLEYPEHFEFATNFIWNCEWA